jgi:hypothetical protein
MELPVLTDPSVSLEPPRKRHRVRNAFVLLLVAGLAMALAGQASHILGGDSSGSSAPPVHKAKPAKAPPTTAGDPGDPADPTQDPTGSTGSPDGDVPVQELRLYLSMPDVPDAQGALDATRAAMQEWTDRGYTVSEVADAGEADRVVRFAQEWAGEGRHHAQSSPLVVGLGDSACDGAWQAYRAESVQMLAAHAIGHALGQPDSAGDVMDPSYVPLHEGPCQIAHGAGTVEGGRPAGKAFTLEAARTVAYTMQESYGGAMDVCFVAASDWDSFSAGYEIGDGCQSGVSQAQGSADLPAGDYMLGFRCQDSMGSCHVEYTIALVE